MRGRVSHKLMHVVDWLPTLRAVAGAPPVPASRGIDGVDQWPALSTPGALAARTSFVYNIDPCAGKGSDASAPAGYANFSAIRVGDFKYIDAKVSPADTWQPLPGDAAAGGGAPSNNVTQGPWLFNVIDDPTEHHNLLASNPGKAAELKAALDAAAGAADMVYPFNCKGEPGANTVNESVSCPGGIWTPWDRSTLSNGTAT